jgi:hypothetical protein
MSFDYRGSKNGGSGRNLELCLIGNSKTIAVGELVRSYSDNTGALFNPAAAVPVLGVVHAICDAKGLPIVKTNPGAGTAFTSDTNSVTTGSDNTTTLLYWALVDTSKDSLYSAQVNGTLGTTVGSTMRGCRLDVDSANTNYGRLLESTATRTNTAKANMYSHGLDPQDSTRLIVNIAQSELDSNI